MKTIKTILKGILVWATLLLTLLSLCSIDNWVESNYGFAVAITIITLIYICSEVVTKEEFNKVTGNNLLDKFFGNNNKDLMF